MMAKLEGDDAAEAMDLDLPEQDPAAGNEDSDAMEDLVSDTDQSENDGFITGMDKDEGMGNNGEDISEDEADNIISADRQEQEALLSKMYGMRVDG